MVTPTPWSLTDPAHSAFAVGTTGGVEAVPVAVWLESQFAVVWQAGSSVLLKPLNALGQPDGEFATGADQYVLKSGGAAAHNLVAGTAGALGVVAVWEEGSPGATLLKGAFMSASATTATPFAFELPHPAGSGALSQASVAAYETLVDNTTLEAGFHVVYTDGTQVLMQRYMVSAPNTGGLENQVTAIGAPTLISAHGSHGSIVSLHDGQLAVAYEEDGAYKLQVFKPSDPDAEGNTAYALLNDPTRDGTPAGTPATVDILLPAATHASHPVLISLTTGFMAIYAVGDEIHARSFLGTAGQDGWTGVGEQVLSTTGGLGGFHAAALDSEGSGVVVTWKAGGNLIGQVFGPGGAPLGDSQAFGAALGSGEHASSVVGLDSGLLGVVTATGAGISAQLFDTRAPGAVLEGVRTGGQRETLVGTAGNDTFDGKAREDQLHGGPGYDTAVYSGTHGQYGLIFNADGSVSLINGPDAGTAAKPEILTGIEFLRFSDGTYQLAKPPAAAIGQTVSANLLSPASLPATVSIATPLVQMAEGREGESRAFTFFAIRDPGSPSTAEVTLHWTVTPDQASAAEFEALEGDVTIARGQTTAAIRVMVKGDNLAETNEHFTITLSPSPSSANPVTLGTTKSAEGIITNDDPGLPPDDGEVPTVDVHLIDDTAAEDDITYDASLGGGSHGAATIRVDIDGGSNIPGGRSFTVVPAANGEWSLPAATSALADGAHTVIVTAINQAGVSGPSSAYAFTLDTTAPAVTARLVADTGRSSTDGITSQSGLIGTGEANASVELVIDGAPAVTVPTNAAGIWRFTPAGLADGVHHVTARATDIAGNTGSQTLDFTLDRVAPAFSFDGIDDTTSGSALLGYTLSGLAETGSTVSVTTNATLLGTVAAVGGAWSVPVTPAVPSGVQSVLTMSATDDAGNASANARLGLIVGTAGNGFHAATGAFATIADLILGLDGNDTLTGGSGNDTLDGGQGADQLFGGLGQDKLLGGLGADSLWGGRGNDSLDGGDGADQLSGEDDNDVLQGAAGTDSLFGGAGTDTLLGGADQDSLWGGTGNDSLDGGDGADSLSGEDGNDILLGGVGADTLFGGNGIDTLLGGVGLDSLWGGAGGDSLDGGEDADQLSGEDGNDILAGGAGADTLFGGNGADTVRGQDGADSLWGAADNDLLEGGAGDDRLSGEAGNDTLAGGSGADSLIGGSGLDIFRFLAPADGGDTITDFNRVDDDLEISVSGFGLAPGSLALASNQLVLGTQANAAIGQFVYNQANGQLLWDADGTGAVEAVLLATLTNRPALTVADFHLIA